jgi:ribonuclease J
MQQAIRIAERTNRKVAFIGRSIQRKAEIARKLGYISYGSGVEISAGKAANMPRNKVLYIISGCYGQPGSALYRVAHKDHKYIHIDEADTVIFSGDPAPPGSKMKVDYLVDRLLELKVDVHYYDMQEDLHVSGHGSQEDIKLLFGLIKPRYFIPIGGTIRHMRAYNLIAQDMGNPTHNVFELLPGDNIEFSQGRARRGKRINVKEVLVDGLGIGDVGNVVLRDRRLLSQEGFAVAVMQLNVSEGRHSGEPELLTRGFVFEKDSRDVLQHASKILGENLKKGKLHNEEAKQIAVDTLEKFFFEEIGRRPMIIPIVIEL